jgi:RND family efflux transporter MFP subunit
MKNYAFILGMGAIAVLESCSSKNPEFKEEKFQVITPLITDTVYINEYVANINAIQNVEIRARVSGFIENIYVDEGQNVHKGQTLFSINDKQFQQDLRKEMAATKSVLAELNSAEIELKGSEKLLDKNFISQTEYELAASKVEALRANLEEAREVEAQANLNVSYAQVKAPFDGIINRIPNKSGSLIEEGGLLTTISNNKKIYAYFNVSEIDYLDYIKSRGEEMTKEVSLVLANGTIYPHKGIIETIESEFDKSTGTIAFRAGFPNPDQILKHGATGKIQVKTALKNVMLIPQKSTFDQQEHICVYIVDSDSTLQIRKIIPLVRLPGFYVVASGLLPHDLIIYEGMQRVKEGDKIMTEAILLSQVFNQ